MTAMPATDETSQTTANGHGLSSVLCCAAMGLGEPWPTHDVLAKLIEAAEILLHEKNYDGHGWELIEGCVRYGKERIPHLRALAADFYQHNA